ncbi:hypothetical protein NPIL_90281, partial [Nephila pilipes]
DFGGRKVRYQQLRDETGLCLDVDKKKVEEVSHYKCRNCLFESSSAKGLLSHRLMYH